MVLQLQQLHVANINEIQDGTIDFRQAGPVLGLYPLSQAEPVIKVSDFILFVQEIMNRSLGWSNSHMDSNLVTPGCIGTIEFTFKMDQALMVYQLTVTDSTYDDTASIGVQVVTESVRYQSSHSASQQVLLDYRNSDFAIQESMTQQCPIWNLSPQQKTSIEKWYSFDDLQQNLEEQNGSFLFCGSCDSLLRFHELPEHLAEVRNQLMSWLRQVKCYTFDQDDDWNDDDYFGLTFPMPSRFSGLKEIGTNLTTSVSVYEAVESELMVRQINCVLAILCPELTLEVMRDTKRHNYEIQINTQPELRTLPISMQHIVACLGGLIKAYYNPEAMIILPRTALDVPLFTALLTVMAKHAQGQVIFTAADSRLLTPLQPTACVLINDQKKAHYQPWIPHAFPVQPAEAPCVSLPALHQAFEQAAQLAIQL